MKNLRSEVFKYISEKQEGSTLFKLISAVEEALRSNLEEDGGIPAWIDSLVDAMIGNLKQVFKQAARDRHVRASDYLRSLLDVIAEQGIVTDNWESTITGLDAEIVVKEGMVYTKKRQAFYYDITKSGDDERKFKRIKKELKEEERDLSTIKARLEALKVNTTYTKFYPKPTIHIFTKLHVMSGDEDEARGVHFDHGRK